jgi:hypothetical protein
LDKEAEKLVCAACSEQAQKADEKQITTTITTTGLLATVLKTAI